MADAHAFQVQTLFRGVMIGTKQIVRAPRKARRATFVIGPSAKADAPVPAEFADVAHTLVAAAQAGDDNDSGADNDNGDGNDVHDPGHDRCIVHVTPRMTGTVFTNDQAVALSDVVRARGPRFALGPGARAQLECGAVTFLLSSATRAPAIAAPPIAWRAPEQRYHLATALGIGALLLALLALPEDPRSLALDMFAPERGLVRFLIKPTVAPPEPTLPTPSATPSVAGGASRAQGAKGVAGAAGLDTSRDRNRRLAVKRSADDPNPRLSPPEPAVAVKADQAGVLGVLRRMAPASAIFARESAFGDDAETVLGQLVAGPVGVAYGPGGLSSKGTGSGGGDTGAPLLGAGRLRTMGVAGDDGPGGLHYGDTAGHLVRRQARVPEVFPSVAQVRGSLDREIVRRIIRRHLNEVRFCYEQALANKPNLGGRIQVQFTIAPNGQVVSAVLQSTTLGNARLESCTVQAVRRWEFPKPLGGGLVMVSYPFVLTPAGGGE